MAHYYERTERYDLCEQCGDWASLTAICDFATGRTLHEWCDTCLQQWEAERSVPE